MTRGVSPSVDMTRYHINKELSVFAHKNLSTASNNIFSIAMLLLVLVGAAQNGHSVNATASSPNADSIFYRINTSIRSIQDQFWRTSIAWLRRRKKKLAKLKCYLTVDETHDSYTGRLHKKPLKNLTKQEKIIRQYIHKYKPKKGDTGSFKYLVFALVYGKKKRVLRVKAIRAKESYWQFVAQTLKELYHQVKFECALLDRGFYVAELVDQLQQNGTPFVIRAQLCDTMKKIYGIYREWKRYDYQLANWLPTTLVLGKDWRNRQWGLLTNLEVERLEDVRHFYSKRWNIENVFKATDGIQLRVATSNHKTRMFAVCLSFLIYNAWQQKNKRSTLLDYVKQLFEELLKQIFRICSYRNRLKLNLPLWSFVQN
jgi:hypothetical protein